MLTLSTGTDSNADQVQVPTGFYVPTEGAIPFSVWQVENPDGGTAYSRLQFTHSVGESNEVYMFEENPGGQWSLTRGWGLETQALTESTLANGNLQSVRVNQDNNGNVSSEVQTVEQYFAFGRRLISRVEDPDNAALTTSWTYDGNGFLQAITGPIGGATMASYTYEPTTSLLLSTTDAKEQVTTYGYNLDNSLSGVSYSGTSTPAVAYTYDSVYPRISTMSEAVTGTTTYSYNPASIAGSAGGGMPASVTNNGACGYTLSYGYDGPGRVASRAIDGGTNTETNVYDLLNRVTQVANVTGTFNYALSAYTDRIDHITYPNGQLVQYAYYGNGTPAEWERLQTITNYPTSSSTTSFISQFGYGYNAAGDITSWTQQSGSNAQVAYSYGYDGARELLSASKTSGTTALDTYAYRYDAAGNRLGQQSSNTVTSSAYNDLNQVTSISGTGLLSISGSLSQSGTNLSEPGTVTAGGKVVSTDSNGNFTVQVPVVAGRLRCAKSVKPGH